MSPRTDDAIAAGTAPGVMFSKNDERSWGLPFGTLIGDRVRLWCDWESATCIFAGMRRGKSQAYAIPWILSTRGAVISTGNKPDVYAATALLRRREGHREWRFDPGNLLGLGEPAMRFDPLLIVRSYKLAKEVAGHFVSAAQKKNATVNSYFDSAAHKTLAAYMLAAALVRGDLVHVYEWLSAPRNTTPAEILAEYGYEILSAQVRARNQLNDRQQEGIFDMGREFLDFLGEPTFAQWVTPEDRGRVALDPDGRRRVVGVVDERPVFDPAAFATSTDTLYAVSQHGEGSPAPLVTALIGCTIEAGRRVAGRYPRGRLPSPMLAVLDEAANICRIRDLPDMISYCGGVGIVLVPIFQSRHQGYQIWEDDFRIVWDTANNLICLGGNRDKDMREDLSELIGQRTVVRETRSTGSGSTSFSQSISREAIIPGDRLAAMPPNRAILAAAGNRPVLIEPQMAYASPRAGDIKAAEDDFLLRVRDPIARERLSAVLTTEKEPTLD
ncbi:type IV secretory system conjugative DNA transfer family protein [Rhodococcus sp. BH5]|uniref:type IV secretory system conjugative DNA transfer family protein n=1 Tax=Rhodococcus sp. BH5 TaxID=2871702 RepID=UPI0022CD6B61|nr:type IV secretory system conjugative DNA transfer family protein [Rhodococcus sp. BH5]MCZ9635036.1 TraM recognition domain-containing protein [Rhodococcus sp. BH5]